MTHNFDEVVNRRNTDSKKYSPDFFAQDVLPMWIADTDFKCPQPVVDAVTARAQHGIYGYPFDQKSFSEAVCHWMRSRFEYDVPPEAITYCPGVIPGVICAVRAFSDPGDKVVVQTPCYPPFRALVINNGRTLLENRMILENGRYEVDFTLLEKQLSDPRTRILLLCNPQNPTGRVFSRSELERMLDLCVKNDVIIVCDEIHCDLVYAPKKHITLGSISEKARENSVVFVNPSKTFNTAGFRTAAMVAPNAYLRNRVYQHIVSEKIFGRTIFGPLALVAAYNECAYYADELIEYLTENLSILRARLAAIDVIDLIEPEATYLIWLDCHKMCLPHSEVKSFFESEAKVGLNDGITFGPEGECFMRFNIACPRTVLDEGIRRIESACKKVFK
ncbi:MAG: MalY/PatB family protein [Oscillospiraceae bacterium]|nr:MalY/PatB family protein [Oscillospiraceae bacterium]